MKNLKMIREILDRLFPVYLFLLIFNTINKGLIPFSIDLRTIITVFSIIYFIILIPKFLGINDSKKNPITKWIILLYLCVFITTCVTNDVFELAKGKDFRNLVILNAFNFLNILVVLEYEYKNMKKSAYKFIKYSSVFLVLSQAAVLFGIDLPYSSYFTKTTASVDENTLGLASLFGVSTRIDGYGIDPNYVSMIMTLFISLVVKNERSRIKRCVYCGLAIFSILISFSRTTILLTVPTIIVSVIITRKKKNSRHPNKYGYLLVAIISICMCYVSAVKPFSDSNSMSIRYSLWERSIELSKERHYLGAGLGAFRDYSYEYSGFYVQNHSTMFQIISEHGIITYLLFCIVVAKILNICDKRLFAAMLIFFVWSFTYEIMYIPHTILYFGVIPRLANGDSDK